MKIIQLTQDKVCLVDDEDYKRFGHLRWYFATGYAKRKNRHGSTVRLHRLIMNARPDQQLDHVSMDKLDNRRRNLRFASPSENQCNQGPKCNNSLGIKGVYRIKHWNGFSAEIKKDGVRVRKTFVKLADAIKARARMTKELHGKFGRTAPPKVVSTGNIRPVPRPLNMRNTSGFPGVTFDTRNQKWAAYLQRDHKRYALGYFASAVLAAKARVKAENAWNAGRFPDKLTPERLDEIHRDIVVNQSEEIE